MPRQASRTLSKRTGLALIESTDVPSALLNGNGRCVHWNAAFETLTGYGCEQPPPAWAEFVLSESLPDTVARASVALETRTLFAGDLLCRRAPDTPFWCDITLVPVPADEGDEPLMLAMLRDSSARRMAESALSGPETQDRFVLDRIQSGIVVHDASTRILYANNKASELLGITYDRMLGLGSADARWEFLDEQEQPLPLSGFPVSRVITTGESVKDLIVGAKRPNDGRMVWGLCHAFPVRDVHGQLAEIVVSFTDVTALKESERALTRSEARLALVFEATNDALWDLDLASDDAWCSPRFWSMFGHQTRDTHVTRDEWLALIHPDDVATHLSKMTALVEQGARTYELELRMQHRAGHDVLVQIRGIILRDAAGTAVRITGAATEITARRAMESRLQQSQKLESVGQLAGGVAHDFNNLLAIISGNLELLADGEGVGDEAAQLIHEARSAARRGAELTRRLLTFSRQQPLHLKVVSVQPLLENTAAMMRRLLPESVEIVLPTGTDLPPIKTDAGLFENALLNLAINARDAMPAHGRLTITADVVRAPDPAFGDLPPGEYVKVCVADTGCGMSPEVVERAIEPFFTTKAVGQGTGLGLSMVYGFVQQCGGTLLIHSQEGAGTTVCLLFPAASDAVTSGSHASVIPARTVRARRDEVILVVEDDPSVRMLCLRELSSLGFRTLEAGDGPSALAMFDAAPRVDLLLTDIVMPGGMNGSEVAATLRDRDPRLQIVFMSGYHADILQDIIRDDATHLLTKPFSIAELAALLGELLPLPADAH
ncbi:PAS domain S-box protein [Gemmatimonas sp.]